MLAVRRRPIRSSSRSFRDVRIRLIIHDKSVTELLPRVVEMLSCRVRANPGDQLSPRLAEIRDQLQAVLRVRSRAIELASIDREAVVQSLPALCSELRACFAGEGESAGRALPALKHAAFDPGGVVSDVVASAVRSEAAAGGATCLRLGCGARFEQLVVAAATHEKESRSRLSWNMAPAFLRAWISRFSGPAAASLAGRDAVQA